jgi:hypothetical protein
MILLTYFNTFYPLSYNITTLIFKATKIINFSPKYRITYFKYILMKISNK